MTIQQLSNNKVMISLCNDDMKNFELDFDTISAKNPHSKKIIGRLLDLACKSQGLSTKDKSVVLEALPYCDGCVFLISINDRKKRKRYRIKKINSYPCYKFSDCETFLCAVKALHSSKIFFYNNSAYMKDNCYYLVFDYPLLSVKAQAMLCEYAKLTAASMPFVARLKESATVLSVGNAIANIGSVI